MKVLLEEKHISLNSDHTATYLVLLNEKLITLNSDYTVTYLKTGAIIGVQDYHGIFFFMKAAIRKHEMFFFNL